MLDIGSGIKDFDEAVTPWPIHVDIEFTVTEPVVISQLAPYVGEVMVNPTREITVRFSDEIDPQSFGDGAITLIANSLNLPGKLILSSTNRFATFFPTSPLPASTEVRIVVDGNVIMTRGGQALDADGDGLPGGVKEADFTTSPLTSIAGTSVSGYVLDAHRRSIRNRCRSPCPAVIPISIRPVAAPQTISFTRATYRRLDWYRCVQPSPARHPDHQLPGREHGLWLGRSQSQSTANQ